MTIKTKDENRRPRVDCASESEVVRCLPCEIGEFCRNHYYTGKLLTGRDLIAEQHYHVDKRRLHNLHLHGWGVVCGLKVKPHPHCPELKLVIEPGLAIDGCGREILVTEEILVDLPQPPPPPPAQHDPCPPDPPPHGRPDDCEEDPPSDCDPEGDDTDSPADPGHPRGRTPEEPHGRGRPDVARPDRAMQARDPGEWKQGPDGCDDEEDEPPPDPCVDTHLYVCIRYVECETEFQPAPFDECACDGNGKQANRICEGFRIDWEVRYDPPADWARIRKMLDEAGEGDCTDLPYESLCGCPQTGWPLCIPLAVVREYAPGVAVTERAVDNRAYRVLLPSTRSLSRLIQCILDKLPVKELTRIEDVGWSHNREYEWRDFKKLFVGEDDFKQGFEITFDDRVRTDGLSEFTYQALVVRHGRGRRALEVVPSEVWASEDRTKFYLRPDAGYLRDCLGDGRFDLYLILHCGHIVDDRGCPVDGDLHARLHSDGNTVPAFPTGDGVPGGSFKSWITVLPSRRSAS